MSTDPSVDDSAWKALAERIIAQNEAARNRFRAASERMLKATLGEDNVGDIIRDFFGQGEKGGTEPVETGDVDKDAGSSRAGSGTTGVGEEPAGGEQGGPAAVVGQ